MSKIKEALKLFNDSFNCSQSVLGAFCKDYGLDQTLGLKLASGFGGGMARSGRTCGLVSGAYMVLGLKYGMGLEEENDLKEKTYEYVNEFNKRFKKIHGSVMCRDLLGCNIDTIEGRAYYDENNFFEKKCLQYLKTSVKLLEEML